MSGAPAPGPLQIGEGREERPDRQRPLEVCAPLQNSVASAMALAGEATGVSGIDLA